MPLTALALNCPLKPSPADSSCDLLLKQTLAALQEHGVEGELPHAVLRQGCRGGCRRQ